MQYAEYLKKIADLAGRVSYTKSDDMPDGIITRAQRALFNNLESNEKLALEIDGAIMRVKKDNWKGNPPKELEIKGELYKILNDEAEVERVFAIVKQQNDY